ncbi:MAG TPA: hypothetical protein VKM37_05630 [Balneolaceae bacterium]|nr:hypothetical protein [Balneolaceae bacterium]
MWYNKRLFKAAATILFVSIFAFGCSDDSTGPEVDEGPPPPVFSISSLQTTLVGGDPGIRFLASSNVRVRFVEIVVTNPNGDGISYSPQGLIMRAGETFDLQEPGIAFFRWSGNWSFKFVGNHEPGGQEFTVTQGMTVSAKDLPD